MTMNRRQSVGSRGVTSANLPAHKVRETDDKTRGENGVARPQSIAAVAAVCHAHMLQLGLQNDGHNDTVDGHSFTEDDTAQGTGEGTEDDSGESLVGEVEERTRRSGTKREIHTSC